MDFCDVVAVEHHVKRVCVPTGYATFLMAHDTDDE